MDVIIRSVKRSFPANQANSSRSIASLACGELSARDRVPGLGPPPMNIPKTFVPIALLTLAARRIGYIVVGYDFGPGGHAERQFTPTSGQRN